jgi:ParB/RepB/Spo0J family partition protein
MKKITRPDTGIQQISINRILPPDNVRDDYGDIEQLARSIERDGLLQPIKVSPKGGNYRIVYGHRRAFAYRMLADEDKPLYSTIPAIIETAPQNIIAVQLIENIQRKDLTPEELEKSVRSLVDSGMSQADVARRLNKREQWVSDVLAAGKVRETASAAGADMSGISTSAASQIRSVPKEKLPEVIKEVKAAGGTVKAATMAVKKQRKEVHKQKIIDRSHKSTDSSNSQNQIPEYIKPENMERIPQIKDALIRLKDCFNAEGIYYGHEILEAIDAEIEKL